METVEQSSLLIQAQLHNKLIAVFDGGRIEGEYFFFSDGDTNYRRGRYIKESKLKYHTSWDWIVPVVQKIHRILNEMHKSMPPNSAKKGDLIEVDISYGFLQLEMERIYPHVITFIEWYNKQN